MSTYEAAIYRNGYLAEVRTGLTLEQCEAALAEFAGVPGVWVDAGEEEAYRGQYDDREYHEVVEA